MLTVVLFASDWFYDSTAVRGDRKQRVRQMCEKTASALRKFRGMLPQEII